MVEENYMASAQQQFVYYKSLAENAMHQLEPGQLFFIPAEDSNSIAIIVQHMVGNMKSRWSDFLTTDGEKEWRHRDEEFEIVLTEKETLMQKWEEGWDCLFAALNSVKPGTLAWEVQIRKEKHTVLEAINRQLAHYPYHVGQIVFIAKLLKGTGFTSLSIPKNRSEQFNQEKFAGGKN
jgi:hypothetical protein